MCEQCGNGMVHLHVHTDYSLLDGASQADDLVQYVSEIGQKAVAITDHGVMFNAVNFFRQAKEAGVKPIIGQEAYLADASRHRKDKVLDRKPFHLLLIAKNQQGYQNLMKISSLAHVEGFYFRPRADWDLLEMYHEGIIATSGCLAAEVPQFLLRGDEDEAIRRLKRYQDVFGDDFYLEVQYRLNSPDQHMVNDWLIEYGNRHGIPLVATTDAHYVRQADSEKHDTLLCIQTGGYKSQSGDQRMKFDEDTYYITTEHTMRNYFGGYPSIIDNTVMIAEQCEVELETTGYHLPNFSVPDGYSEREFLTELCQTGLEWRYGSHAGDDDIQERLQYELNIIDEMGFTTYFLVVWDICEYSRHAGIWWNVRGSGAGSVVAYSLGITAIDPLKSELYFERFLNPSRKSMPDIDLDFEDVRRNELVDYIVYKYGDDKVAGIITFGTLSGKAAVRDVGRVMGIDQDKVARISKHVVPHQGKTKPLDHYLENDLDLREMYDEDPEVQMIWDEATRLQNYPRHSSTHPAGFIVTPEPIIEYVPLHRLTGTTFGKDTPLKAVTQFEMETAEELGLLKIDLLGLSTLSIMKKTCEYIKERHGHEWDVENIPYRHNGDPEHDEMLDAAFALMGRGETAGVFQIEGTGMTSLMKHMKPERFDNIVAALSLYRPGPMGVNAHETYVRRLHGEEAVEVIHPELEPILEETYGLLVYQEQVMAIASRLFGYTPGKADYIRKAVGKKKLEELEEHYEAFITEGEKRGIPEDIVEAIWEQILYFAGYGFNKAHASDYAKICVQTAFLKAHYLIEYMTALLQVYLDKTDKLSHYLDECRRLSINVLPPDINYSRANFSIERCVDGTEAIRCGLTAVKHVGDKPVSQILSARGDKPFKSLGELVARLDLSKVNRRALESLIVVGAFGSFGKRWDLLCAIEEKQRSKKSEAGHIPSLREYAKNYWKPKRKAEKRREEGIVEALDMFEMMGVEETYPDIKASEFIEDYGTPPTSREMLDMEKEAIGFYVTARPSDAYRAYLREEAPSAVYEVIKDGAKSEFIGHVFTFGGEVTRVSTIIDKNGNEMAFIDVQDWHDTAGTISGVVFSSQWGKMKTVLYEGNVVTVTGRLGVRNADLNFIIEKARTAKNE